MSGPPHWLAYAWVVSLWVAAGCVVVAGVAAVVDWREARRGRARDCAAVSGPEVPPGQSGRARPLLSPLGPVQPIPPTPRSAQRPPNGRTQT